MAFLDLSDSDAATWRDAPVAALMARTLPAQAALMTLAAAYCTGGLCEVAGCVAGLATRRLAPATAGQPSPSPCSTAAA